MDIIVDLEGESWQKRKFRYTNRSIWIYQIGSLLEDTSLEIVSWQKRKSPRPIMSVELRLSRQWKCWWGKGKSSGAPGQVHLLRTLPDVTRKDQRLEIICLRIRQELEEKKPMRRVLKEIQWFHVRNLEKRKVCQRKTPENTAEWQLAYYLIILTLRLAADCSGVLPGNARNWEFICISDAPMRI